MEKQTANEKREHEIPPMQISNRPEKMLHNYYSSDYHEMSRTL